MRGAVFDGKRIEVVDDLEVMDPGPGEVRVRIEAAGVCHSDVSVADGTIPYPTPVVLGHEGAGVVEALGSGVDHLAVGNRVVLSTIANCGHCEACDRGRPTHCRGTFGNLYQRFRRDGEPVNSFAATSTFVEQTVVRGIQAVRIPDDVPATSAALIGCAVLTGTGAVLNRAKVRQGQSVGVIGAGGIGLNAIQGARMAGALPIIAIDTNPKKEEVARRFGATHFVDASRTDAAGAVREICPNGLEYVFECVGRSALIRLATELLDWGGSVIVIGVPKPGEEASFDVSSMYHDKAILMCRYGGSRPQHDIPMYAELYRSGRLLLDELVSATYSLGDVERAMGDLEEGKLARGVLVL